MRRDQNSLTDLPRCHAMRTPYGFYPAFCRQSTVKGAWHCGGSHHSFRCTTYIPSTCDIATSSFSPLVCFSRLLLLLSALSFCKIALARVLSWVPRRLRQSVFVLLVPGWEPDHLICILSVRRCTRYCLSPISFLSLVVCLRQRLRPPS